MPWVLAQSGDGTPPSWADEFQAFTSFHAVAVSVCIVGIGLVCSIGRRWRGTERERRLRLCIGWGIVAWQAFATVWRVLPGQWDLAESLPLHMCRVVGWVAALALLTGDRRARSLAYFWGLGLSTQGFVTPMWSHGYASVAFWMYWLGHGQIVLAAVYDLSVLGYTPRRWDWGFASLAGLAYAVVVVAINMALGTNYSYLGSGTYDAASVVDVLGPWPWRVLSMIAGAWALFTVLLGLAALARFVSERLLRGDRGSGLDVKGARA